MKKHIKISLIFLCLLFSTTYGQIITTIGGNGVVGSNNGDGGPATAARINYPTAGKFDRYGNYYFVTGISGNSVRKIDASGFITTIAGTGSSGYSGDGAAATAATLNGPQGIALDSIGNVFVADAQNNVIRKINISTGIISTYGGTGMAGFAGDGMAATSAHLYNPNGLSFDKRGNLFIADYNNYRVRKIDANGIITTVAGTSIAGFNGDGGLADTSQIRGGVGHM